jgi:hypothetical protein
MSLALTPAGRIVMNAAANGNPHLPNDFTYRHRIAEAIRAAANQMMSLGTVDMNDELSVMYSEGWNHCCKALLDLSDDIDFNSHPVRFTS